MGVGVGVGVCVSDVYEVIIGKTQFKTLRVIVA